MLTSTFQFNKTIVSKLIWLVLRSDFTLLRRYIGLPCFLFLFPHPEAHVRYNLVDLLCTIQSGSSFWSLLYDINLRATHTMILSIRGVMIPIYLVSSATDSIKSRIVLFETVTIPTSDPKSEFLCQSSISCAEPTDSPWTPCTPGISPMPPVTTYHPYCHSLSALTEYLKQKLHHQWVKWLGRSPSAQVEPDVPLERNINSDFTLAATIIEYIDWRGERNVPRDTLRKRTGVKMDHSEPDTTLWIWTTQQS